MTATVQKPFFIYAATVAFLLLVITSVLLQQLWLLILPVAVLFYIWAFEKPAVLFYLLIASIPWSVEYQFSDALGTDFPDEPLMWGNALLAFAVLVYNHRNLRGTRTMHLLILLLFLQLLWAMLTVITSTFPLLSVKYVLAKSWYLLSFVALPLLLPDAKKTVKHTALIFAVSTIVVVALTMIRHAAASFTFATINDSLKPFFRNHVNYSALLVCIAPVLAAAIKLTPLHIAKRFLYAALFLSLVALYFSYARGAWMALAAGVAAYGLLKKKALVVAFILTIIFTISSVFWLQQNDRYLQYAGNYNKTIFHTDFAEHIVATYELNDLSTAERFYRWVAGVRMVNESWKTGFGPNTFYANYKPYTVPAFKTWVSANEEHSTVHNYFLLLLIEQGVFGLLLFVALLAVAFYTAQKIYHRTSDLFWKTVVAAVAVILVMICTVNFLSDLVETDKVGSVFYLCLAVLLMGDKKTKKDSSEFAAHVQRIA